MDLKALLRIYEDLKCSSVYVKRLAANDNSKNQVYFGGNFEVLNILPIGEITTDKSGNRKEPTFKASLNFYWLDDTAALATAPNAQLILYPQYPEVRFSGYLLGCKNGPSDLMGTYARIPNRLLFIGVTEDGKTIGHVVAPESEIANEFNALNSLEDNGVFFVLPIRNNTQFENRRKLLLELKRVHSMGWINSKRLDKAKNVLPCNSSNCGGYTLECELGITPNGYSEPDYLGWEVKQFGVTKFSNIKSKAVTLMTPEPTDGYYVDKGVEIFLREYGYPDKNGKEARINFGGKYQFGVTTKITQLRTDLIGYDLKTGKIVDPSGYIALIDQNNNIAASWSFSSLLKHWNTKHANACYIPSISRKVDGILYKQQYCYGNQVLLGTRTDFSLFLQQFALGNVYYDPAIKLELAIQGLRNQNIKRRSQFRITSRNLINLYQENEIVNLDEYE